MLQNKSKVTCTCDITTGEVWKLPGHKLRDPMDALKSVQSLTKMHHLLWIIAIHWTANLQAQEPESGLRFEDGVQRILNKCVLGTSMHLGEQREDLDCPGSWALGLVATWMKRITVRLLCDLASTNPSITGDQSVWRAIVSFKPKGGRGKKISLMSRPTWRIQWDTGQPGLQGETVSKKEGIWYCGTHL